MSILIETTIGDIVIDLYTDECPMTTKNFLKLCKIKYYNGCLFYNVQKDFIVESGDPTNSGKGGESIYGLLYGQDAMYFNDEIHSKKLTHHNIGTVSMANNGKNLNASRFYITTRSNIDYLDEKHTVFGQVVEGLEVLADINRCIVDEQGRPFKNIRILHTIILHDPFPDPPTLEIPDQSPDFKKSKNDDRIEADEELKDETKGKTKEEIEEMMGEKSARGRSELLEMLGVLPTADVKPPENVLFVAKLNPLTESEDLELVFSKYGSVKSCEVIRDRLTGDSLCYAFVEYESKKECETAYTKMNNTLVDDRRIHVDFSQSVSKVKYGYGVERFFNRANSRKINSSLVRKEHHLSTGTKGYDYVFDENEKENEKEKEKQTNNYDGQKKQKLQDRDNHRYDDNRRDNRDNRHYDDRRRDDRDNRHYDDNRRDNRYYDDRRRDDNRDNRHYDDRRNDNYKRDDRDNRDKRYDDNRERDRNRYR